MEEILFSAFKKNPLLEGLKEEELRALFLEGQKISLRKGAHLIHEGDPAKEIFFLMQGSLIVSKESSKTGIAHTIATLSPGALVGEIALLDKGTRSASVIAASDAELIAIPFSVLDADIPGRNHLYKVFLRIAQNMSDKLRKTDNRAMAALADQVDEYKKRLLLGDVFIATLFFICTYFYAVQGIKEYATLPEQSFYFTLPLTLTFMLGMVFIIKKYNLPWKTFGITLHHWKRAVFVGIFTCIPVLFLMFIAKWVEIHFLGSSSNTIDHLFQGHMPLFETLIYLAFIVPLQELLARGGIQGLLTEFLSGKYKVPIAILASSVIFGTAHLFISFKVASIVLLMSFYLGWLYSRNQSLISVWIAHGLIGIWGLGILGI